MHDCSQVSYLSCNYPSEVKTDSHSLAVSGHHAAPRGAHLTHLSQANSNTQNEISNSLCGIFPVLFFSPLSFAASLWICFCFFAFNLHFSCLPNSLWATYLDSVFRQHHRCFPDAEAILSLNSKFVMTLKRIVICHIYIHCKKSGKFTVKMAIVVARTLPYYTKLLKSVFF